MDEIIKLLDIGLDYVSHEIKDGFMIITVKSNRGELICPFCGTPSSKVHSLYPRKFQDLPIQGKKVIIIIENRKMFCYNPECRHKTFAENFPFLPQNARRTKRLTDEMLRVSLNCSSVSASRLLSNDTADIGKTAICRLLKKQRPGD